MLRHTLAALGLFACLAPLRGTTLERLTLDDLILKSTAIVRGRVLGSTTALSGRHVFTHIRVSVTERWKGSPGDAVDIVVPGGTAGGIHEICDGAPRLTEGQEYVLFLWAGRSGINQIIGFTQGVFTLSKSSAGQTLATRSPARASVIDPGTGQAVSDYGIQISLAQLTSRITAVLQGGGQ